jgi:hypothetical protein
MKRFFPGGSTNVTSARNATLLNLFATPGLGSLLARRWVAGTGQLVVFLAGFLLFLGWFVRVMKDYYGLMFNSQEEPDMHAYLWMLEAGVVLCAIAWVWALVTSLQLLRAAKPEPPPERQTKPPVIPK